MTRPTIIHNAYLENLGDDWVAIADNGHPVGRAGDELTLRIAVPDAAHYLCAKDLDSTETLPDAPPAEDPVAAPLEAVKAQSSTPETDADPVNLNGKHADGDAFDHDGDGKVGGSKPRARKAAAKK